MRRVIGAQGLKSMLCISPYVSSSHAFKTETLIVPHSPTKLSKTKPPNSEALLRAFSTSIGLTASVTVAGGSRRGLDSNFLPHVLRCISSSVNSMPSLEWNEPISCSEVGVDETSFVLEEDAKSSIPVRAYFLCTSVNLRGLVQENRENFIPTTSRITNYVVLRFGNLSSISELGARLSASDCCYMVVFQYGSIVLFNISENMVDGYLKIVERHASGLLSETKKDEYEVIENPTLSTWMEGGLDYIMLQYLSIDGIRTIGSVLGQSIALDYYVRQVDDMVAKFTDINCSLEKTGTFEMDRKNLFQLLGKANSTLSAVILKLGLFERSDIAWKNAKYAQIWEYLRDEFELTQRFANLDFKLKFVEHNIRFLQEILQNRKSDFLEWMIIVLIAGEFMLSVYQSFPIFHGSIQP